jgi:hypothetical protein
VVVESPKIEINHPNQTEQIARLEKAIAELAGLSAKQAGDGQHSALPAGSPEQTAMLERAIAELHAVASKQVAPAGLDAELVARLEKTVEQLTAAAATASASSATPHPPGERVNGAEPDEAESAAAPLQSETHSRLHFAPRPTEVAREVRKNKSPVVKQAAKSKKSVGRTQSRAKAQSRARK